MRGETIEVIRATPNAASLPNDSLKSLLARLTDEALRSAS
jgi:hypothetical protein